ncbi:MAG: hypothetical protein NC247_08770 [Ruminococcus flavefaciens]|nr:hypothetical protein [Ruminococcus flavefaciens]MCM1362579.1 hypothetical protein [Clostridiales bacterium]
MATFSEYKSRLRLRGNTARERALYHEKFDVKTNAVESLSCKDCIVGGIAQKLVIDDGTLPYYKEVCSLPDETFNAGQYVEWADTMWLIVSCDWDKEVYTYGKMQQCNWLMKWQNADGEIIERWVVVNPASKYSNGEKSAVVITIPSNNYIVYLPNDSETLALPVDKRIFVDFNVTSPKCYEITRIDTVTMSYDGTPLPRYDGKGCVLLVLTECLRNSDTDRIDLMLCDYINPESLPQPSSPIEITYSGSPEIRIGGRKTFSTEVPVTFSLIAADMWKDKILLTQMNDHSCKITADNESAMVGANIKIIAKSETQTSELLVKVIGGV